MRRKLELYIEKVTGSIEATIGEELELGVLDRINENDLHILFENRKHAKELLCELNAERTAPSK